MKDILINNPQLEITAKSLIILNDEFYNLYKNDQTITIYHRSISIEFLYDLLINPEYQPYIDRLFDGEIKKIGYCLYINGDITGIRTFDKSDIIKGLVELNKNKPLKDDVLNKFNKYLKLVDYEAFKRNEGDKNYSLNIDNVEHSYSVSEFIKFLELNEKEYNDFFYTGDIFLKENFIFALVNYFKDNSILSNYILPDNILGRLRELNFNKKIDIEALNEHLEIIDHNVDAIEINNKLRDHILSDIDPNLSTLEKSIYIYIKMCKTLTYDDEFYAYNQTGEVAKKHEDINHIKNITPTNNVVVCYEFNAIYGILLRELGLNFTTDQALIDGYGGGHANLSFRCGKFLIKADSVTSILSGDLIKAKLDLELEGIYCKNTNLDTKIEFQEALDKVYSLLRKEETFEDILKEYERTTTSLSEVPLTRRLRILLNKANSTYLNGIDNIGYIIHLRNIMFSKQERQNNFRFVLVRNNQPLDNSKTATASTIFLMNNLDLDTNSENNRYFYYYPNIPLEELSIEELQYRFDQGYYSYTSKKSPKIPGIIDNRGISL